MLHKNNFNVPRNTSLYIIGDIHEHEEQFFSLLEEIKPDSSKWIVSVGDVWDKGFGEQAAKNITSELIRLNYMSSGFVVKGNHELKLIRKNRYNLDDHLKWWSEQPLSLRFNFYNGTCLTVVHAGIAPYMSIDDLSKSVEVCYVREIDSNNKMIPLVWKEENGKRILVKERKGILWHHLYDGRFGYVVAGHIAQHDGLSQRYNYSCNIDTAVYDTGILSCQPFNPDGSLMPVIQKSGPAAKPMLNEVFEK